MNWKYHKKHRDKKTKPIWSYEGSKLKMRIIFPPTWTFIIFLTNTCILIDLHSRDMAPSWQKKDHICPHFSSSTYCKDFGLTTGRETCSVQIGKEKTSGDVWAVFKYFKVSSAEDELGSIFVVPEAESISRTKEWEWEGNKIQLKIGKYFPSVSLWDHPKT